MASTNTASPFAGRSPQEIALINRAFKAGAFIDSARDSLAVQLRNAGGEPLNDAEVAYFLSKGGHYSPEDPSGAHRNDSLSATQAQANGSLSAAPHAAPANPDWINNPQQSVSAYNAQQQAQQTNVGSQGFAGALGHALTQAAQAPQRLGQAIQNTGPRDAGQDLASAVNAVAGVLGADPMTGPRIAGALIGQPVKHAYEKYVAPGIPQGVVNAVSDPVGTAMDAAALFGLRGVPGIAKDLYAGAFGPVAAAHAVPPPEMIPGRMWNGRPSPNTPPAEAPATEAAAPPPPPEAEPAAPAEKGTPAAGGSKAKVGDHVVSMTDPAAHGQVVGIAPDNTLLVQSDDGKLHSVPRTEAAQTTQEMRPALVRMVHGEPNAPAINDLVAAQESLPEAARSDISAGNVENGHNAQPNGNAPKAAAVTGEAVPVPTNQPGVTAVRLPNDDMVITAKRPNGNGATEAPLPNGSRKVTMNVSGQPMTTVLTPDQAAQWDEINARYQTYKQNLQQSIDQKILLPDEGAKQMKALSMKQSAELRQVSSLLTAKEQAAADAQAAKITKGKAVQWQDESGQTQTGTVLANPAYGKVKVRPDDGSTPMQVMAHKDLSVVKPEAAKTANAPFSAEPTNGTNGHAPNGGVPAQEAAPIGVEAPPVAAPATLSAGGGPMFEKGQTLPENYVYHNTTPDALKEIEAHGMTAGSFSDRPLDFGGKTWIAVSKEDLPNVQTHQYGSSLAYEPAYVTGYDAQGFPIEQAIPRERIYVVNKQGKVLRSLAPPEANPSASSSTEAPSESGGLSHGPATSPTPPATGAHPAPQEVPPAGPAAAVSGTPPPEPPAVAPGSTETHPAANPLSEAVSPPEVGGQWTPAALLERLQLDPVGQDRIREAIGRLGVNSQVQPLADMRAKADFIRQQFLDSHNEGLFLNKESVKRLSGPEILARHDIVKENGMLIDQMSKVAYDPNVDPATRAQALQAVQGLADQNDRLLGDVLTASSQKGRDLVALKNMANASSDPEAYLLQAKRILGDAPLTPEMDANIRRLVAQMKEACG